MASGDFGIFANIVDRLNETGVFDGVYRSALPEVRGESSGDTRAAVVAPISWEQTDECDDEDTVQATRRVTWTLTLIVRDDDPETREWILDELMVAAQNALDGQSLGGLTINDWTRLRSGRYEAAAPPEQRMTITGQFAYWIEGFDGNAENDDD